MRGYFEFLPSPSFKRVFPDSNNLICTPCTTRIKDYGFVCFEIIEQVCRNTFHSNVSYYHEHHSPDYIKRTIQFLERKGLLVTTDIDEQRIAVQPNLRSGEYDCHTEQFCWCKNRRKL